MTVMSGSWQVERRQNFLLVFNFTTTEDMTKTPFLQYVVYIVSSFPLKIKILSGPMFLFLILTTLDELQGRKTNLVSRSVVSDYLTCYFCLMY